MKCHNCGQSSEAVFTTDDDVDLCEACYREVPTGGDDRVAMITWSALERVTEVGPCPACGRLTVKDDDGGTRCLNCAGLLSEKAGVR